jgi:hypothetical protein
MRRDVSQFRNAGYDRCHGFHGIAYIGDRMLLHRNKTVRRIPPAGSNPEDSSMSADQFQGLKRVVTFGAGGGDSPSGSSAC